MSMVRSVSISFRIDSKVQEVTREVPADAFKGGLPALEEIRRDEVRRYIDVNPEFVVLVTISDPYDNEENIGFARG